MVATIPLNPPESSDNEVGIAASPLATRMSDGTVIVMTMRFESVPSLLDAVSGSFVVLTATGSRYLIDLDVNTLIRLPFDDDEDGVMRRDGEPVRLVAIRDLTVGRPGELLVFLGIGMFLTTRVTSTVVEIFRCWDDEFPLAA